MLPPLPSLRSRALLAPLLAVLLPALAHGAIERVTRLTAAPERYGRVDFDLVLSAEWTNPYRTAEVAVDLELVAPSGKRVVQPVFFVSGRSGEPSVWQARFAPTEAGEYHGEFALVSKAGREVSSPVRFTVAPSARRGFLHPAGPWIFRYNNGQPFRALGENLGWEARNNDDSRFFRALHQNPRFHYEYMIGQLAAHGGNFYRTWMCAWNLPLEWKTVINTDRYTADPGPFNASAIRRMDELVALSDSLGVHLMLTLDSAGAYSGPEWELNSYNRRNGGPAANAAEFFTAPAARAQYRDRLRYLVARWGYSPAIAAWEFFNEVDNLMYAFTPRLPDATVAAWHDEMSRYLKQIDPIARPVTTSISHRDVAGLNDLPAIDFNQRHIYKATTSIPAVIRDYTARAGKPYVIGEFGYEWDWSKDFAAFAPEMERDFHRGHWLGLFSPTPILPMTWWWEYFDEQGLTAAYAPVRALLDHMLAAGGGEFAEQPCILRGDDLKALAVRCGDTVYTYVWHDAEKPAGGTVQFTQSPYSRGRLRSFDSHTSTWTELPSLADSAAPVEFTVPARGDLILVLEPLPSSAPTAQ